MWQPTRGAWWIIWVAAAVILLAWPPAQGKSLGLKAAAWLVDPMHHLPYMPPELPVGMGDDGAAVEAHDTQLTYYWDTYDSSAWTRFRINVRDYEGPLSPTTERQLLVGFGVFAGLIAWKVSGGKKQP
jgi:hypothetical protein